MSESGRTGRMTKPEIIVIGGGVSGLSCAHELAAAGRAVELWTAEPSLNTTSMVAAAFWYPYRAEPIERVAPWAAVSYERFTKLMDGGLGPTIGVYMREAIELFPALVEDPAWARYVRRFRHARADELAAGYAHGIVFEAPVIEMPLYLPWLLAQVEALGVEIELRHLDSLEPALSRAPVVINTTGLGARELVDDARVYPVRGQILRRSREQLERVIIDEHGTHGISYIVPRGEDVILGGVADEHVETLAEDPAQTEAIFARCARLSPELAGTRALGVNVGLRPCRDVVRVESEDVGGDRLLMHDYGHGGAGVTLSWGCAAEVCTRVLAWLDARPG